MLVDQNGEKIIDLDEFIGDNAVVIYADSTRNKKALDTFLKGRVIYICDKDEKKTGKMCGDIKIISCEQLEKIEEKYVLYSVISDWGYINELARRNDVSKILFDIGDKSVEKYVSHFVRRQVWFDQNEVILNQCKQYKYIHFIPDEKFVLPMYYMICDHCSIEEHLFIIHSINYTNEEDCYNQWNLYEEFNQKTANCFLLDDCCNFNRVDTVGILESLLEQFQNSKTIIFHSGQLSRMIGCFFEKHKELVCQKSKLIVWGAERGYHSNHRFFQSFLRWVPIVWGSEKYKEIYIKVYQFENYKYNSDTGIGYDYIRIPAINSNKKQKNSTVNIMVGHSGSNLLDHLDALRKIEKHKENNINVFCPLSYDTEDKKKVEEVKILGNKLFGKKFIAIEYFLNSEEYIDFLNKMDVIIMPMKQRVGLTNCRMALRLGKKVYVYKYKEILSEFFDYGIECFEIDDIPALSFEQFVQFPNGQRNAKVANKLLANNYQYWKTLIFEEE